MNLHTLFQSMTFLLALCFYVQLQPTVAAASAKGVVDVIAEAEATLGQPGLEEPLKRPPLEEPVEITPKKPKMMGAINKYRAKICADMKDQHGNKFSSYDACDKFMRKACHPGADHRMDGDGREVSSGEGYCKVFFNKDADSEDAVTKAKKQAHAVKTEASEVVEKARKAVVGEKEKESTGHEHKARSDTGRGATDVDSFSDELDVTVVAPSPSAVGAPGAAYRPTEGDTVKILNTTHTKDSFPEGIGKDFVIEVDKHLPGSPKDSSQPYQVVGSSAWLREADVQLTKKKVIAADEKWYYKNDKNRFHMDEDLKLPAQGYWGKLVEHDDMKTSIGDWQSEFGSKNGPSPRKICESHPENTWCQRYVDEMNAREQGERSAASATLFHQVVLAVAGVFICGVGRQ